MKRDAEIDRDKVHAEARKLDGTRLRVWLDRAIDMLPDEAFPELIADYVHLRDVLADENTRPDLLRAVRQLHRDSLAGRYYQDFMVNSRNLMEKSRGTETFIAEHSRMVDACLRAEQNGELETAAEGLGLLIDLMREIDECRDDIVFFADEAGSWQVGVLWDRVLPAWFRSLSPTTEAYEWAETVVDALNDFASYRLHQRLAMRLDDHLLDLLAGGRKHDQRATACVGIEPDVPVHVCLLCSVMERLGKGMKSLSLGAIVSGSVSLWQSILERTVDSVLRTPRLCDAYPSALSKLGATLQMLP